MIYLAIQERIIGNKDWATMLFLLCFVVLAINKALFSSRFAEFVKLGYSDKYIKIYKDSGNIMTWFTISFFFIQVISFSFFLLYLMDYYGFEEKTNWVAFIRIATFICVFVLTKYLTEKIIATAFNIEEFNEQFNLHKVNYRAYIGLLLLPVNIIMFYNKPAHPIVIYILLIAILLASATSYLFSLRIYQNIILGKLFYFILYLCALEIAPYYFMYYWFTNG